ncbi:MAG: hypothetical protein O7G85_10050, partial [Planctomycetota bacterium]|nr:hypothetical protein [Planctomycetota bacterium]
MVIRQFADASGHSGSDRMMLSLSESSKPEVVMMRIHSQSLLMICAALMAGSWANTAFAQDALGAGNALDANLNTRSRSNIATPRINFRQRNLLITGDVTGGRGFRGTVGYNAVGDFGGRLGSDDLFPFLRDSALSSREFSRLGPAFTNIRHGATFGGLEYRRSTISRGVQNLPGGTFRTSDLTPSLMQMKEMSLARGFTKPRDALFEPSPLGRALTVDGRAVELTASSLQGISMREIDPAEANFMTSFDRVRVAEDTRQGRSASRLGFESMVRNSDLLSESLIVDSARVDTTSQQSAEE